MTVLVVSSLAALWGWFVLNLPDHPAPIRWIASALRRLPQGAKLIRCPWCIGAWLSLFGVATLHASSGTLDWTRTPLTGLASAGLTGLLATLLPDDGNPTE